MVEPIDPQFHGVMNALARGIDDVLNGVERPKRNGFVLLVFEFGKFDGGRVNYISNGERADTIAAMKEYIARAEGRCVYADPRQTGGAA